MRILILVLSILAICWNATAQDKTCTETEAIEAESSVSSLHNWDVFYKFFKRFHHCGDDGGLAEGYSDSVVRLLAEQWDELATLKKLTSSDKDFYNFVLRHIDATTDKSQVEKILSNCSKRCPESASELCSAIKMAAKNALSEFKE